MGTSRSTGSGASKSRAATFAASEVSSPGAGLAAATKELSVGRRIALLAIGYTLFVLGGPGVVFAGGTPFGALGLVFWALATSRQGPWKKRIEWLAGATALTAQTTWMGIVFWFALPWLFVGYGCWSVWGGWLSKRLAARWSLALSTPLAWIGYESLLAWTPPPIGLSWLRLGHYVADWPALAGSGRVWGVAGLGFVLASLAGLVAELVRAKRVAGAWKIERSAWIAGLVPVTLAAILALVVRAPETEVGPRLLLVDLALPQKRKQGGASASEIFFENYELTRNALDDLKAARGEPPNLVCWSETMMRFPLAESGLREGISELAVDPWHPWASLKGEELLSQVDFSLNMEREVLLYFFGGQTPNGVVPRTLAQRTQFVTGIESNCAFEGRLRRTNSVVLWGGAGERLGLGRKRHLAPGGETMVGLEAFEWVRDIIFEVAAYVPDLLPGEETTVFKLAGDDAATSWSFGATVCFDNAFSDSYAEPLRAGPLDFHLVLSNEAWYGTSQEFDQMVAFSKMHALCTGRSLVRCSNGGVSGLFGADGTELARLRVNGRDRQTAGTLVVDVPVPTERARATRTPYVWLEPWLLPSFAILAAALAWLRRPPSNLSS